VIPDLTIELLGVWIWVSGDTKEHRALLGKDGVGMRWARDKKAWYWRSPEHSYRRKNKPTKDLNELRQTFGAKTKKASRGKFLPSPN